MSSYEIVGTHIPDRGVKDAIRGLFAEDGTVYLISGFFTVNAYQALRPDIVSFLDRSPDNALVLVVGSGMDQFSADIANDLWNLDTSGSIRIYRYPHGFLHAKLYLRIGATPMAIVGSINLTRVAFEQNLELGVLIRGESVDDPRITPLVNWVNELLEECVALRRRHLLAPLRLMTTLVNWVNKGRLLPVGYTVRRISFRLMFVLVLIWALFGNSMGP